MESKPVELQAEPRTVTGKKVRQLRREGWVPAHVYGRGQSLNVQIETKALQRLLQHTGRNSLVTLVSGGSTHSVMLRAVEIDHLRGIPRHVDLEEVSLDEPIHAQLPLVLTGEAPATKSGSVVLRLVEHLNVEGLPTKLPHVIHVDVSHLTETGQTIHIRDLALPEGISVLDDPDEPIVKVEETRAEVEAEAAAAATEEGAPAPETPGETGEQE